MISTFRYLLMTMLLLPLGLIAGPARMNGKPVDPDLTPLSDGKSDATSAIQTLMDATAKSGGCLELPAGQFRIDGSLNIPTGVTLKGVWESTHHGLTKVGTCLMLTGGRGREEAPAGIRMNTSTGLIGLTIAWPEQSWPNPVPYPWAVLAEGMHCQIENITLVNAWNGIAMGSISDSSLCVVRNVYGCVLRRGLFIDNCYDISRVENVHFNPHYWPRSDMDNRPINGLPNIDQAVANVMRRNLEAFIVGRNDWGYFTNCFVYGAKIGIHFIQTKAGSYNGQMSGCGVDGAIRCVVAESVNPFGIIITNGQFVAHPAFKETAKGGFVDVQEHEIAQIVTIEKSSNFIQFNNCTFWGTSQHIAHLQGRGAVSFHQCCMRDWGKLGQDRSAILCETGKLTVLNSMFNENGATVTLARGMTSAKILANTAQDKLIVKNAIGDRAIIRDND